jgi:hypothetical protein
MPDVHSIKRGYDQDYDPDFQKQNARSILTLNSTKQSTVPFLNLDLLKDLSNAQFPYLKQCSGEIRLVEYRRDPNPIRLALPSLEEAGSISLSILQEGSTLDLRSLRTVKRAVGITISGSVRLDNLETCGEKVWIGNPQSDFNLKEIVSLPKLRSCSELVLHKALKVDLSSLQSCKGGIYAPECMEIILPTKFKGRKKLGKGCKITLV